MSYHINSSVSNLLFSVPKLNHCLSHIPSFVHRRSHITASQHNALSQLSTQWCIPYTPAALDLNACFNCPAPTILEIGFGMGETTAQIAQAQPQNNFLTLEVFNAGVGALLQRIKSLNLRNIRIIQHDAFEVIRDMIMPNSLAGVHIFFPDPWPKTRHHKRRLIQPLFIAMLASRITSGGYLHCATDWKPYAQHMLEVLKAEPALYNTAVDYIPRPSSRPLTKFEQRGLRLGHAIEDLMFIRKS